MSVFQPGQLVRQRSGGPVMIVKVAVRRDGQSTAEGYRCEWIVEDRIEEGMFTEHELVAFDGNDAGNGAAS